MGAPLGSGSPRRPRALLMRKCRCNSCFQMKKKSDLGSLFTADFLGGLGKTQLGGTIATILQPRLPSWGGEALEQGAGKGFPFHALYHFFSLCLLMGKGGGGDRSEPGMGGTGNPLCDTEGSLPVHCCLGRPTASLGVYLIPSAGPRSGHLAYGSEHNSLCFSLDGKPAVDKFEVET